ncbi:MAG: hypothetical protein O2897_04805, partial [bacterium]|nr:hypothetical protein [bacterium]
LLTSVGAPLTFLGSKCLGLCCVGLCYLIPGAALLTGATGWWIADTVRFGKNEILDGHGHKLESW